MITLSQEDFDLALGYWQVQTTAVIGDESFDVITKFPYDYYPGQVTGGTIQPLNTKEAWDRYIWNPPEFDTEHFDIDETASGKPNWHQIVESAITARRELAVKKLRAVCQDKITRDAFGEDTLDDERNLRMAALENNMDISSKILEKNRLTARYREIRDWINQLTDLDQLSELDFDNNTYWGASWNSPT